jgi:nitrile hydratase
MDGIHDLGGMHGFGPVRVERDEPVFHSRWEGRVYALTGATGADFTPNIDKFRHAIERMEPVEYLSAGYYGRWLRAIETRLVEAGALPAGAVDRRAREIAAGTFERAIPPSAPPGGAAVATTAPEAQPAATRPRSRYRREVDRSPIFATGATVRVCNLHPAGHTRLPRYVRGKRGRVETIYAAYVFPDTHAHDLGEEPQYLYCVAFEGEELWGRDAEPGTRVYLDLFEPYLHDPS